jgi:ubiquinone/menaquinone biosynthesis C-methylase UbiE
MPEHAYLPAAGRDALLRFYDPVMRLIGAENVFRAVIDQAALQPSHAVLDIGCGTGTLAVLIKRLHPTVDVIGVDPDPKALALAQAKANKAGVAVRFDRGFADALAYGDKTFDRVFSSMMFHHLRKEDKPRVLAEVHRVLEPGGWLELLDFAGNVHSFFAQVFHGRQPLPAEADDPMLRRLREAGFVEAARSGDRVTVFGRVGFYRARASR